MILNGKGSSNGLWPTLLDPSNIYLKQQQSILRGCICLCNTGCKDAPRHSPDNVAIHVVQANSQPLRAMASSLNAITLAIHTPGPRIP